MTTLSYCKNCGCVTKTIKGKCGKCKIDVKKPHYNRRLEVIREMQQMDAAMFPTPNRQSEWAKFVKLNAKIMKIRASWAEISEYCQDEIMEEVENYCDDLLASYRQKLKGEVEGLPLISIGCHPIGIKDGQYIKKSDVIKLLGE